MLRYFNPAHWLTSFSLWWLELDVEAIEAAKARKHRRKDSQSTADESPIAAVSPAQHLCTTAQPKAEDGHLVKEDGHLVISVPGQKNHSSVVLVQDRFEAERLHWQNSIRDKIFSWDFNVFDLDTATQGNPLITVTLTLLETHQLLDGWKISRPKVINYLLRIESEYNPSSYHNSIHAADVTQTAAVILSSVLRQLHDVSKMDIFCIVISAAVHDLGHLGVNNDFLISSKHPRATRFNDKSVNEMFHISRAFEIMRESEDYNIFDGFTPEEAKRARKLMVDMVLATDMAIHFDLLKRFSEQLDSKPSVNDWVDTERALLFQMLVHLADIANPSRPFRLARGWAERVIREFCEQGDQEAGCGLPVSPFCNRAAMNMPKAQLGFINIFLKPTLAAFEKAAPDFIQMAQASLDVTIAEWKALEEAGFMM